MDHTWQEFDSFPKYGGNIYVRQSDPDRGTSQLVVRALTLCKLTVFFCHQMALHISLTHILKCYIFKIKPEVNYFFLIIKKHFLVNIRGSKQCHVYLINEISSTRLVCHDSNYVDIYLINVQLCVKSREAGITGQRFSFLKLKLTISTQFCTVSLFVDI